MDTKDKLCSNLDNFYKTLENIMGNIHHKKKDFDFYKLLSLILLDEFNKIVKNDDNIIEKIYDKIFPTYRSDNDNKINIQKNFRNFECK